MLFFSHGIVLSHLFGDRNWDTRCRNQQEPGVNIVAHGKESICLGSIGPHPDIPGNNVDSTKEATNKVTSC